MVGDTNNQCIIFAEGEKYIFKSTISIIVMLNYINEFINCRIVSDILYVFQLFYCISVICWPFSVYGHFKWSEFLHRTK